MRGQVSQTSYGVQESYNQIPGEIYLGQVVEHPSFGQGVIMNYEGAGSSARVQVNFEEAGSKWLVLAYANLQLL
jgi:DNA helicase-2/ATP-dependent DNA helicase PcrA